MSPSSVRRSIVVLAAALTFAAALPAVAEERVPVGDDTIVDLQQVPAGLLRLQDALEIGFDNAYSGDPMGLVAYRPFYTLFTRGNESWDVWLCRDPSKDSLGLQLGSVVDTLNGAAADYFAVISEGRYRPVFRAAGTSSVDTCGIDQAHATTTPRIYVDDWSVLVDNSGPEVGQGGPGTISWTGSSLLYEGLSRRAEIDGAAVVEVDAYPYSPAASIAAHEIGHTLHWAHSGAQDPYDNELDIMSLGWGGTHGFNLYAAGWMTPEQVALHPGGDRTYAVGPMGVSGTRMIVLTTGETGHFYALSVRRAGEPVLDANSPPLIDGLGVEVYEIDQRPGSCAPIPDDSPCFGILASVSPVPARPGSLADGFPNLHAAGETFDVAGVTVTVASSGPDRLSLTIEGGVTDSGWFVDDDASIFESDIEWVAAAGITKGCNPPRGDFFCPRDDVTRGQMAAFLVRTLGLPSSNVDAFTDDDASVFEGDINALAASGITTGCTETLFCPDAPVTRGQMAAFLNRAYELDESTQNPFTDDDASVFEGDINALAASGITTGCTETLFCPRDNVTRGQMAAFLKRAETR